MGYIWQNYGIYGPKTIGDITRYIWQQLWDIFGKKYGIYWDKTIGYFRYI